MNGCKKCPAYAKCTETYRGSGCAALRWTYGLDSDPKLDSTDREKLLSLIQKAKDECARDYSDHTENEYIADTLLDNGVTFAKDTAKNVTSIDTVEVVRCRDCRYRKTERCQMYWESEDGREQYNWETDDDFCSSGKRRDEHSWKR